jgi:glycosyltransferase involved in cell wall biosynthesis
MSAMRLLGVAISGVSDWRTGSPGKWSGFFAGLAARYDVIDVVQPAVSKLDSTIDAAFAALSFHPNRELWRRRFRHYPWTFDRRTRRVERALGPYEGRYDAIVQAQTLCAPGTSLRRYVIYTDNTFANTARHFPQSIALPKWASNGWLAREEAVAKGAARVFTMSEFARRSFIEDYGCDQSRVIVIGAGAQRLEPDISNRTYDKPVALFVGLNFEHKGGFVLLEAWKGVARALPGAELVLVGATPTAAKSYPGVRCLGRVWDGKKLRKLFLEARVFVMPSLFEPWGLVFHEAMGHGLPCIGTDCCAMPEIIDDGATGLIVSAGDADQLAEALKRLLSDAAEAEALGREAHRRVLERHTWTRVAERLGPELAASD